MSHRLRKKYSENTYIWILNTQSMNNFMAQR